MSDGDAVAGEAGGYVPCGGASALVGLFDDTAAIFGEDAGYVPASAIAATEPSSSFDDSAALYGSTVGFVATPCADCLCGITDTFLSRVVGSGFGTADCGLAYSYSILNTNVTPSVDGSEGIVEIGTFAPSGIGATFVATIPSSGLVEAASSWSMQFNIRNLSTMFGDQVLLRFGNWYNASRITPNGIQLWINSADSTSSGWSWDTLLSDGAIIPSSFWQTGIWYTLAFSWDGSHVVAFLTDGTASYSLTGQAHQPIFVAPSIGFRRQLYGFAGAGGPMVNQTFWVRNLVDPDITLCTLNAFDNFARTTVGSWGMASSGSTWTTTTQNNATVDVSESDSGLIGLTSSSGFAQAIIEADSAPGDWWGNASYDMTVTFQTDNVSNTGRIRFLFFEPTFTTYRGLDLLMSTDVIELFNAVEDQTVAYAGWSDHTLMTCRFQVEAGVAIRVRVWPHADPEPSTWNLEVPDVDATVVTTLRFEADDAAGASDSEINIYPIDFTYAGKPCY